MVAEAQSIPTTEYWLSMALEQGAPQQDANPMLRDMHLRTKNSRVREGTGEAVGKSAEGGIWDPAEGVDVSKGEESALAMFDSEYARPQTVAAAEALDQLSGWASVWGDGRGRRLL